MLKNVNYKLSGLICIFICTLWTSGCGLQVSYKANRPNDPKTKSLFDGDKYTKNTKYPEGNLQYLQKPEKRNNEKYFASAREYSKLRHNIAKEYISDYTLLLNTDAEELENAVKAGQFGMSGDEILSKMETGELRAYPLKDNVLVMQKLHNEKDKIAKPHYMDEYMDIYKKVEKPVKQEVDDVITANYQKFHTQTNLSNEDIRNQYIEHYLATTNDLVGSERETFKEYYLEA